MMNHMSITLNMEKISMENSRFKLRNSSHEFKRPFISYMKHLSRAFTIANVNRKIKKRVKLCISEIINTDDFEVIETLPNHNNINQR